MLMCSPCSSPDCKQKIAILDTKYVYVMCNTTFDKTTTSVSHWQKSMIKLTSISSIFFG